MTELAASDVMELSDFGGPASPKTIRREASVIVSDEDAEAREKISLQLDAANLARRSLHVYRQGSAKLGSWVSRVQEVEAREGVDVGAIYGFDIDSSVFPGQAATAKVLTRERNKEALAALIDRFSLKGFSWTAGRISTINARTMVSAKAFLQVLPPETPLPRVSPDGEGGLLMLWEETGKSTLLVIDGWTMHLVESPTTPRARYLDDVPFDGEQVPARVLQAISLR